MARDSYVRVAYKGFLFPLGIRASLLKVSERKFQRTSKGRVAGYLRQRMFIVIREPVKAYPAKGQPNDGRQFPFGTLRMTTLVTPNLDLPGNSDICGLDQGAFWPTVNRIPFHFHVTAEDSCEPANDVDFAIPLIFVQNPHCFDDPCHPVTGTPGLKDVFDAYYAAIDNRTVDFAGQKFCYAPSQKSGDTLLETQSLLFGAAPPDSYDRDVLVKADQPAFYPCLEQAGVHVASIEQLTGGRRSQPIQVFYHPKYVDGGFAVNSSQSSNKGEVFFALVDPLQLSFKGPDSTGGAVAGTTDKGGGVVTRT